MDLKLSGRTALITGSSKGIGLAVARWWVRAADGYYHLGPIGIFGSARRTSALGLAIQGPRRHNDASH